MLSRAIPLSSVLGRRCWIGCWIVSPAHPGALGVRRSAYDRHRNYISWVSPMARALIKAREGDNVTLRTPGGIEELEILDVRYEPIAAD